MTRIYLPATRTLLAEWYAAGEVPLGEDGFVAPDDNEESEYAALMTAADASADLLAGPGRRVVVVVETPDEGPDDHPPATVPLRLVAAVHADLEDRPVDADPDDDLGWFARQEIPDLLG